MASHAIYRPPLLDALWGILAVDCTMATADPETLHPNIRIRKILAVAKNTIRLVEDPRDDTLYIMTIEALARASTLPNTLPLLR